MGGIVTGSFQIERRPLVEKQIVTVSYWLGLLSSLIALVLRALSLFGVAPSPVVQQGRTIWYNSFFKGALLFFVMAIATKSYASLRGGKTS